MQRMRRKTSSDMTQCPEQKGHNFESILYSSIARIFKNGNNTTLLYEASSQKNHYH